MELLIEYIMIMKYYVKLSVDHGFGCVFHGNTKGTIQSFDGWKIN